MSTPAGFLALNKALVDDMLSLDPTDIKTILGIARHATWAPRDILIDGSPVRVEPGQIVASERHLAALLGCARNSLHRSLERLVRRGFLHFQSSARYTRIALANWHRYRGQTGGGPKLGQSWASYADQLEMPLEPVNTRVCANGAQKTRQQNKSETSQKAGQPYIRNKNKGNKQNKYRFENQANTGPRIEPVVPPVAPAEPERWTTATRILRDALDKNDFSVWIEPLTCIGLDEAGTVWIAAACTLGASWAQRHYAEQIAAAYGASDAQVVYIPAEEAAE